MAALDEAALEQPDHPDNPDGCASQLHPLAGPIELSFALISYRRRYGRIDQAPDYVRRHWSRIEASAIHHDRTNPHPASPPPSPVGLAPGIPHDGSRACFDIRDVPAFCRRILDTETRRRGQSFQSGDYHYEDALSDLIQKVYELARRYDPQRTKSFRIYATYRLAHHAFPDIGRKLLKRNGAALAERAHAEVDDRADQGRRPWDPAPEDSSDLLGSGTRDRAGVEADRVGSDAWRGSVLSLRAPRGVADGARPGKRGLPDSF